MFASVRLFEALLKSTANPLFVSFCWLFDHCHVHSEDYHPLTCRYGVFQAAEEGKEAREEGTNLQCKEVEVKIPKITVHASMSRWWF